MVALLISVLACWRVTHLLHAEDGPGDVLVHLRRLAGAGFFGKLMDCFYCLSLWVSLPIAVVTSHNVLEGVLHWLSISAGAILLERATAKPLLMLNEEGEER
jgi:hypothetical protein